MSRKWHSAASLFLYGLTLTSFLSLLLVCSLALRVGGITVLFRMEHLTFTYSQPFEEPWASALTTIHWEEHLSMGINIKIGANERAQQSTKRHDDLNFISGTLWWNKKTNLIKLSSSHNKPHTHWINVKNNCLEGSLTLFQEYVASS